LARRRFVSRRGLVFSGFVLVLLVISIGTTIATAGPTAYAAFGLALRSSQTAANRTVAAVDGRPITEADLLRALASATLNNTLSPNKVSDTQRSSTLLMFVETLTRIRGLSLPSESFSPHWGRLRTNTSAIHHL
jgi:hypothetical protein